MGIDLRIIRMKQQKVCALFCFALLHHSKHRWRDTSVNALYVAGAAFPSYWTWSLQLSKAKIRRSDREIDIRLPHGSGREIDGSTDRRIGTSADRWIGGSTP